MNRHRIEREWGNTPHLTEYQIVAYMGRVLITSYLHNYVIETLGM